MRRFLTSLAVALIAAASFAGAARAQAEHGPRTSEAPSISVQRAASPSPAPSPSPAAAVSVATYGTEPQAHLTVAVPNRVEVTVRRGGCALGPCAVERYVSHNARTNAGANALAAALGNGTAIAFQYIALSSDATATAAGDTTCPSEIGASGLGRQLATYAFVSGPSSLGQTAQYKLTASWTATATATVAKLCALSAASGGTLGFETVLGASVSLNSGDSLSLSGSGWTFNV